MHGIGRQILKSRWIFEGQWINNQKNGFGRFIYSDGGYFEGTFKNGQQIEGISVQAEGSKTTDVLSI